MKFPKYLTFRYANFTINTLYLPHDIAKIGYISMHKSNKLHIYIMGMLVNKCVVSNNKMSKAINSNKPSTNTSKEFKKVINSIRIEPMTREEVDSFRMKAYKAVY